MRKVMFVLACLFALNLPAQKMVSTFAVLEATKNKECMNIADKGLRTVFYTSSKEEPCMANMWVNYNTQSFGRIYDVKKKSGLRKSKIVYTFKWTYENSYNEKTGMALVTFTEVHDSKGVDFTMKMALENGDVFCYKGHQTPPKLWD